MAATGTHVFTLTDEEVTVLRKLISQGIDHGLNILSADDLRIANRLHGRSVELWGRVLQREAAQGQTP